MSEEGIETLKRVVELLTRKAELEDELKAVKAQLDDLEEPALAYFQRHGIQSTKLDGRTVYVRRELWAGRADGISPEMACETLKAAGFGEFVKEGIVTQSLSSFVREREKSGEEPVPGSLRGVIVANEVYKLGSRRA